MKTKGIMRLKMRYLHAGLIAILILLTNYTWAQMTGMSSLLLSTNTPTVLAGTTVYFTLTVTNNFSYPGGIPMKDTDELWIQDDQGFVYWDVKGKYNTQSCTWNITFSTTAADRGMHLLTAHMLANNNHIQSPSFTFSVLNNPPKFNVQWKIGSTLPYYVLIYPDPAFVGETVTAAVDVSDVDGDKISYRINWGDGTGDDYLPTVTTDGTTKKAYFKHVYTTRGGFSVIVTALDGHGGVTQAMGYADITKDPMLTPILPPTMP